MAPAAAAAPRTPLFPLPASLHFSLALLRGAVTTVVPSVGTVPTRSLAVAVAPAPNAVAVAPLPLQASPFPFAPT